MAADCAVPPRGLPADAVRAWAGAGALAACVLALQAGGAPLRALLRYERAAVAAGEVWRLVTGHCVHLGWAHALLNAAGLLACAALCPRLFRPRLAAQLLYLAAGIGALLWLASPQVADYAGLSGVLYGLFALGLWPQRREPWARAALAAVVAWAAWQWLAAPPAYEERLIGGRIVAVAHLDGLLLAAVWLAAARCGRRFGLDV